MGIVLLDARRNPPTVYENVDVALARRYSAEAKAAGQAALDALIAKGPGVVGAGTLAQRQAYTYRNGGTPAVDPGSVWFRKEPGEAVRTDVWVSAGQRHPDGLSNVTESNWYSLKTQGEMDNMSLGKTGFLPQGNVANLGTDFARYDAQTLNARVEGFRARPLSTGDVISALLEWDGHADAFTVSWGNYTLSLGGSVRHLDTTATNWAAQTAMLAMGDSMLDAKWVEAGAASIGYTLTNVAKYSSGSKQPYRLGVRQLRFTVTGNTIPASGTGVQVTAINGIAPSTSAIGGNPSSFDAFAAHGFLNTGSGDAISVHCSEAGTYGGRHGVVSVPNGGTPTYTFTPDDGLGATAVDPQALFIPDNLAKLKTDELLIRSTQNTFFAGPDNPVFPNNINPRVLDDTQLVLDQTSGQRIVILSLTPARNFTAGTPQRIALDYFNAQQEARWPQYFARIPGIGTNYDYIRAHGSDGSSADIAAIADGRLPESCMATSDPFEVHHSAKGQALEREFWLLFRAYQAAPPVIDQNTNFVIRATAVNARLGTTTTAEASTSVGAFVSAFDEVARDAIAEMTPTFIQDDEPSVTSAALWFKTLPGSDIATLWIKGAA